MAHTHTHTRGYILRLSKTYYVCVGGDIYMYIRTCTHTATYYMKLFVNQIPSLHTCMWYCARIWHLHMVIPTCACICTYTYVDLEPQTTKTSPFIYSKVNISIIIGNIQAM